MPHYPADLGHDRTLYGKVEYILSPERDLAMTISPSVLDKCHGNNRGLDFLSADYEKGLVKLISHYDVVFPQNKEKPFGREHKYWVTNEQFVALFWECLKFFDEALTTKWYQPYLHEKREQDLKGDSKEKLDQVLGKDIFQVNYAELIKAAFWDNHKLAGSQGRVYRYANRIMWGLQQEGVIIREKENPASKRTYLRINPDFIVNQITL